jgi:AraC-like DNA-binding protein
LFLLPPSWANPKEQLGRRIFLYGDTWPKTKMKACELTLSEIAWKLEYSSVAHLSSQFKKVMGLTPSYFKKRSGGHRKSLDQI